MFDRLRRLKITGKLWGTILSAVAALIVTGVVAVSSTQEMRRLGEALYAESTANAKLNSIVMLGVERAVGAVRAAPAELDLQQLQTSRDALKKLLGELSQLLDQTISGTAPDNVKASAKKIRENVQLFDGASKKVFDLTASFAQQDAIAELNKSISPLEANLNAAVRELADAAAANAAAHLAAIGQRNSAVLWFVIGLVVVLTLAITGLSYVIVQRGVSRPLASMTGAMNALSGGDKSVEVPGVGRRDEIGDMASAVQVFKDNMIRADQLAGEQRAEQQRKEERQKTVDSYIHAFDKSVSASIGLLTSASTELQTTATTMSATAEETGRKSAAVAAASEQASTNVQTVASAAEELSTSISRISGQVTESTRMAGQAKDQADRTNAQIKSLAEAAQRIGDVVKLITDIAGQTNLLALNATIEAARAGEAGKGFAVVASEVKSLANQTAKATEEIGAKIAEMQAATGDSVKAVATIADTIGRINEIAATIASAVEEQGAATKEIARNVQQASAGTAEVSSNIAGVTKAAADTGSASGQVLGASGELAKNAETLRGDIDSFIAKVRAA